MLSRAREDDPALCAQDCVSVITRYVWDGDQLLHELRAPGAHSLSQSALQGESGTGRQYGRVTYTHGGGIDQPLGVYREGYANEYGSAGAFLVVPHASWRGRFDLGTYPAGLASGVDIRWPGQDDRAFHNGGGPSGRGDWMGGLLNEQKDASGLMYRRNRYYDPQTGRFTQEDPIGIAGGLNVYGYAAGDPVSYADPYGLCAAHQVQDAPSDKPDDREKICPGGLTHGEYYAREDGFTTGGNPAQSRWIVLTFIAEADDRVKFQGCPERTISHEEYEGMFHGIWIMNPRDLSGDRVEVVYPTFKRLRFLRKMWYSGTVITREYGTRGAAGWVHCDTGAATFETAPFRWP